MKELINYTINKLDDKTVSIQNKEFSFIYNIADYYVKEEFKGKYEYLGGLQCNFEKGSTGYISLEKELSKIARFILKVKE
jgi:hypothetical protein